MYKSINAKVSFGFYMVHPKLILQPNVLREEAKSELLKEMKELLSMRARVRKEVLEVNRLDKIR